MKAIHIIVSVLFFGFAAAQWNDPDPYIWIFLYIIIGSIPILYIVNKLNRKFLRVIIITLFFTFLIYIPPIFDWISKGMPSIIGSMQAKNPYIEMIRESLGLLLSCIVAIVYYKKANF